MIQYILKRLLLMIPTFLGIVTITFFIVRLSPGDPLALKLQFANGNVDPEALSVILKNKKPLVEFSSEYKDFLLRWSQRMQASNLEHPEEFIVYRSLIWISETAVLYKRWLWNILHFDFGFSLKDQRPVAERILEVLPVTLLINCLTIAIVYLVSVPLGVFTAMRKDSWWDRFVMVKLFVFYAMPTFWIATMLLVIFAGGEYFNLFPINGLYSDNHDELSFFKKGIDIAWHLVLPVTADVIGSFAFLTRFARNNFLEVLSQDFMRTARAKGLKPFKVIFKHGLRNAMIPFVTLMGTLLPALIGGSVVIEQIFSIPGIGKLAFEAALGRDYNVIMGLSTISAGLTLLSLFLADMVYMLVDPRIRLE